MTFGSSYQQVRKIEGSRNRHSIVAPLYWGTGAEIWIEKINTWTLSEMNGRSCAV